MKVLLRGTCVFLLLALGAPEAFAQPSFEEDTSYLGSGPGSLTGLVRQEGRLVISGGVGAGFMNPSAIGLDLPCEGGCNFRASFQGLGAIGYFVSPRWVLALEGQAEAASRKGASIRQLGALGTARVYLARAMWLKAGVGWGAVLARPGTGDLEDRGEAGGPLGKVGVGADYLVTPNFSLDFAVEGTLGLYSLVDDSAFIDESGEVQTIDRLFMAHVRLGASLYF